MLHDGPGLRINLIGAIEVRCYGDDDLAIDVQLVHPRGTVPDAHRPGAHVSLEVVERQLG